MKMKDNAHLSRCFTPILVCVMGSICWVGIITINFKENSLFCHKVNDEKRANERMERTEIELRISSDINIALINDGDGCTELWRAILFNAILKVAAAKAHCFLAHFAIHIEKCLHSFHKIKFGWNGFATFFVSPHWLQKQSHRSGVSVCMMWSVWCGLKLKLKCMSDERTKTSWNVSIDTCLALCNAYRMQCKRNNNRVALSTTMSMSRWCFFLAIVTFEWTERKGVLRKKMAHTQREQMPNATTE